MGKKILIADDSLFMRSILKGILSDHYEIAEADTSAKTEQQMKVIKPDLVLLDIVMPEGEEAGIAILKKSMKANPKQKILMISAVGQDSIIEECKKLGAMGYIVKPFDEAEVLSKVKNCLG
jgi:two-component system, chemotaxis family, chemotaxis protein CheY